jgi:ATP sulfurylase
LAVTIELKRSDLKSNDAKSLYAKLNAQYPGQWVAILENGEVIANLKLTEIYAQAKDSKIIALLRASKSGQLLFK